MIKIINKKQGFILPLVIAVVAILAIGGVMYLTSKKYVEIPVIVTPDVPAQVATTTSDAKDWMTYKNEKLGFSLDFPETWKGYRVMEGNSNISFSLDSKNYFFSIGVMSQDEWTRYTEGYFGHSESPDLINLGVKGNNVFVWAYGWNEGWPGDIPVVTDPREEEIKASFKFITPTVKPTPATSTQPVACTMDAMMCPDGSYVGRSGPKCEFVCPKVIEPYIKVLSPNGGEVINMGENLEIKWLTSKEVETVKISIFKYVPECYKDGKDICPPPLPIILPTIIKSESFNDGQFIWSSVGQLEQGATIKAGKYKVSIAANNVSVSDVSDNYFEIKSLLRVCPDSKFTNKMPTPAEYPNTNPPASHYILEGKRHELNEFDQDWVNANCVVKEYSAY